MSIMEVKAIIEFGFLRLRNNSLAKAFTWLTRILLAIGFIPPGVKKIVGEPFTLLGPESQIGYFFDALYKSGFYYEFIGWTQVTAAVLLVIPKTTTIGALIYLPIIINIFVVTVSMHFVGTPSITGLMLLGNIYLLVWDMHKLKTLFN